MVFTQVKHPNTILDLSLSKQLKYVVQGLSITKGGNVVDKKSNRLPEFTAN